MNTVLIRVDQRSKTTFHLKRYSDTVQHGELRSNRGCCFINEFFLKLAFFNIHDTFKTKILRSIINSKDELSSCRCSMTSYGELKTMNGNAMLTPRLCLFFCKKIPSRTLVIPQTWIRKEVVFYSHWQTTRRMGKSR